MLKQKQMLRFAQHDKQGDLLFAYFRDTTLEHFSYYCRS
jgi:hypothetical protein